VEVADFDSTESVVSESEEPVMVVPVPAQEMPKTDEQNMVIVAENANDAQGNKVREKNKR
jgi:hypothetical protein